MNEKTKVLNKKSKVVFSYLESFVEIETENGPKKIRILRIHIEEDAGKLIHDPYTGDTLVDLNRCGVPLIEIVSEPDMRSGKEAAAYVEKMRNILYYLGVSDGKMEEGSMRCDVNISIRPYGSEKYGTRVEIKNLNSLKSIEKAINYEKDRQEKMLEQSQLIISETRGWDESQEVTFSMREKQSQYDYRYFPEPDITPITIDSKVVARLKKNLPEDIETKRQVYKTLGLSDYDIEVLTSRREIAEYFDECFEQTLSPKETANWIMTDVLKSSNEMPQLALNDLISAPNVLIETSAFLSYIL